MLLFGLMLVFPGARKAMAQDSISLALSVPGVVDVSAGGVGTRIIQLSNVSDSTFTTRLEPIFPAGWTMLIPPPQVSIPPGSTSNQLFSFQIPANTRSGEYVVQVGSTGGDDRLEMVVRVLPNFSIEIEWIQPPALVRAGGKMKARYLLKNIGNADVELELEARSSLGYEVSMSHSALLLGAGETKEISLQTQTQDNIVSRQTHSVVVDVFRSDADSDLTLLQQDSFISEIIPVQQRRIISKEGMLPLEVSLSGWAESGSTTGQIQAVIRETAVGDRSYQALVRIPDVRSSSVFASSDQYSLKISSVRNEILLGDQNYSSSELLERGVRGFGAGFKRNLEQVSFGGYAHQTRKSFPKQQQAGGFVHFRVLPNVQIESAFLAKKEYEEGEAISLAAEITPGQTRLRGEYALGWFGAGRSEAFDFSGGTSFGSSTISTNVEWAGANFLGSIQNTEGASTAFTLALSSWLRIVGQARARRRYYDLGMGKRAEQLSATTRGGLNMTRRSGRSRFFLEITGIGKLNENTLSSLQRFEQAGQIRMGFNQRRVGAGTTLVRGQVKDPIRPDLQAYFLGSGNLYATIRQLSFSLFTSYLNGPTFYNPVDQERIMVGVNAGLELGDRTRLDVNIFKSTDLVFDAQDFLMTDARFTHEFKFGHEVLVRARLAQTSADASIRNGTMGVTYRIPLFVPAPGASHSKKRELKGKVVDAETGAPINDVILMMNSRSVRTGADGTFKFVLRNNESNYLSIDRQSIGLDRRPVREFPMVIAADRQEGESFVINVIRSASIVTTLGIEATSVQNRNTALSQKIDSDALAGVVIEARSAGTRIRRIAGRGASIRFSDLVPGTWKIFAVGRSLPEGYQMNPDTLTVLLGPAMDEEVAMNLKARSRGVQIVASGGVSVGTGVSRSRPVQVEEKASMDAQEPIYEEASSTLESRSVHAVLTGETLSSLARMYYESSNHWVRIWLSNQSKLEGPDQIYLGQQLVIPPPGPLTPTEQGSLLEYHATRSDGEVQ